MMFRSCTSPCFWALVARQPDRPRQDHSYNIKTLLVEDSYPAIHTTVCSSPWQKTHKTTVHG